MMEDGQGLEREERTGQHSDKRGEHCNQGQLSDHYKRTCLTPLSNKKQLASNHGRPTSKAYSPFSFIHFNFFKSLFITSHCKSHHRPRKHRPSDGFR